ncbi:Lar family restriction alleviation protein [Ancylobacter sp.]|uniref:Lar family restriction alleviation protein n=1 Tax=Ancylobacter sp. TaxID=1872567 RepID=UPI003BA9B908
MTDRTPAEATLLPCPFCGSTDLDDRGDNAIWCKTVNCEAGIDYGHSTGPKTRAAVRAAWNRRASPPAPAAEPVALDIERIVNDAEIEWSYREDDYRYPRDFWHARISYGPLRTGWVSYGDQEARTLPDDVKAAAEIELRGVIRSMATSLPLYAHPLDAAAIRAEARRAALEEVMGAALSRGLEWQRKAKEPGRSDHDVAVFESAASAAAEIHESIRTLADKGKAE